MIRFVFAFSVTLLAVSPVLAQPVKDVPTAKHSADDPETIVRSLYSEAVDRDALPMTQRLESLFLMERDYLEAKGYPFDRLDFDWIVNGQDALITELAIETMEVPIRDYGDEAVDQFDRKIVTASFKNFDSPTMIRYYWVRERSGWKLDDVIGYGEDRGIWTLSLLLAYGD